MRLSKKQIDVALWISLWLSFFGFTTNAHANHDWAATIYVAQLSAISTIDETLLCQTEFQDSYLISLALARKVFGFKYFDIEMECQAVKHFGDQQHWEFNGMPIILRWNYFLWDKYLETSIAVGVGLSYATEHPKLEAAGSNRKPSDQLLGYLMAELALALPKAPNLSLVIRLHHRSGAGGLIGNDHNDVDASNAVGIGFKICF